MITPELLDFVRLQLSRGMARVKVAELLLSQGGWSREDIGEVFREYDRENTPGFALPLADGDQVDIDSNLGQVATSDSDDFLGMFNSETPALEEVNQSVGQTVVPDISSINPISNDYQQQAPISTETTYQRPAAVAEPQAITQEDPINFIRPVAASIGQNQNFNIQPVESKIIHSFPQTMISQGNEQRIDVRPSPAPIQQILPPQEPVIIQNDFMSQWPSPSPVQTPAQLPPQPLSPQFAQQQVVYTQPQTQQIQPQFIQPVVAEPNVAYRMPQAMSMQQSVATPQGAPQFIQVPAPAQVAAPQVAQSMQQVQDAARVFADEFVATLKAKAAEVSAAAIAPAPQQSQQSVQPVPSSQTSKDPVNEEQTTQQSEKSELKQVSIVPPILPEMNIQERATPTEHLSEKIEQPKTVVDVPDAHSEQKESSIKKEDTSQRVPPVEIMREDHVPVTIASPDMSKLIEPKTEIKPVSLDEHKIIESVDVAKPIEAKNEIVAPALHITPITIKTVSSGQQPASKPIEKESAPTLQELVAPVASGVSTLETPAKDNGTSQAPAITLNIQKVADAPQSSVEHIGARTFEPTKIDPGMPPKTVSVPSASALAAHTTHSSTLGKKTYQDILKQALSEGTQPEAGSTPEKKIVAKSSMESWLEGVKNKKTAAQTTTEKTSTTIVAPTPDAKKVETTQIEGKSKEQVVAAGAVFPNAPKSTKRTVNTIFIVLVTLAILGGISFAVMRYIGPNAANVLQSSFGALVGATSVSYKGNALADLNFDRTEFGGGKGAMKFEIKLSGGMKNSPQGFGDGTHDFSFEGALNSGSVIWSTKVAGQARLIGQALYINATTPPLNASLDPDLLKNYWIKIDLDQIAKELALQGIGNTESYGAFSDPNTAQNFMSILSRNFPLLPAGNSTIDTSVGGVETYRYPLVLDGAKSLAVAKEIYQSLMQKPLVVSEEDALRWGDAMKKAEINVWIGKDDGKIYRFTLQFKPEDSIIGVRTTGLVSIDIDILGLNAPVGTTEPTPALGLDELKVRMEQYRSLLAVRANDEARVALLGEIGRSLEVYAAEKGRYPVLLDELKQGQYLAGTATTTDLTIFSYYPYTSTSSPNKANRCTQKSRGCTNYHIGVNFEDQTHPLLSRDGDIVGEILGGDEKGCAGEEGRSCYDIFTTYIPSSTVSTSSVSTSTRN